MRAVAKTGGEWSSGESARQDARSVSATTRDAVDIALGCGSDDVDILREFAMSLWT
jgi:hypothetical protein